MPLEPDRGRGPGFAIGLILTLFAGISLVLLVWQNQVPVTVRFLMFEVEIPLFVIVLGTAVLAVFFDEVIGMVWRRHRAHRRQEKEELNRLRQGPADSGPVDTDR